MRVAPPVYLAVLVLMQPPSAEALSPVPPDMTVHVTGADLEAQHDQLRAAPVHLQALILDDPPEVLPGYGQCTVDASVIRTFKGSGTVSAGSLFRLAIPCNSGLFLPFWRDRDPIHVGHVSKLELKQGRIIEAYLDHFGPHLGYRLAGFPTEGSTAPEERYMFLSAASVQPRLNVPQPGKATGSLHFWVSGHLLENAVERAQRGLPLTGPVPDYPALTLDPGPLGDRGKDFPPAFPTRYVVQTITRPDRPGRQYRILYDPNTWRTRVDELDAAGHPTDLVQYGDAFSGMEFGADTRVHTVSRLSAFGGSHGEVWLGTGWGGLTPILHSEQLQGEGSKIVANVRCPAYHIVEERWSPHAFLDEGHICLTDDGIALETSEGIIGSLPYRTIKVEYPNHLDASEFNVPQGRPIVKN